MQNNSTGMLATSVPVAVVPNAPRCPSWKIHTSAPNAAVSDKMLSSNAFNGNTTLPVSKNSSTNVIAAITASTVGSRDVIASELSRLICAVPVIWTSLAAGTGDGVQPVQLGLRRRREQSRGAAHGQECAAVLDRRSAPTAAQPVSR